MDNEEPDIDLYGRCIRSSEDRDKIRAEALRMGVPIRTEEELTTFTENFRRLRDKADPDLPQQPPPASPPPKLTKAGKIDGRTKEARAKRVKVSKVSSSSNAKKGRREVLQGKRPPMKEAVARVIGKRTMTATEIREGLRKRGWLPNTDKVQQYISYILSSTRDIFERVEHGKYRVRNSMVFAPKQGPKPKPKPKQGPKPSHRKVTSEKEAEELILLELGCHAHLRSKELWRKVQKSFKVEIPEGLYLTRVEILRGTGQVVMQKAHNHNVLRVNSQVDIAKARKLRENKRLLSNLDDLGGSISSNPFDSIISSNPFDS